MIALVVGHSKEQGGASSHDGAFSEFYLNKQFVTVDVMNALVAFGLGDVSKVFFRERNSIQTLIHKLNEDSKIKIIVSFHANSFFDKSVSGTEVLYWNTSSNGKRLAECIQEEMVGVLKLNDRGVKPIFKGNRGWAILGKTRATAVLLEPFFISNKYDLDKFFIVKKQLAAAIVDGIAGYLYEVGVLE